MPKIHPTAVVDPGAKLADDVTVGALSTIGSEVELGAGVEIGPHVCITGRTRIGRSRRPPHAGMIVSHLRAYPSKRSSLYGSST